MTGLSPSVLFPKILTGSPTIANIGRQLVLLLKPQLTTLPRLMLQTSLNTSLITLTQHLPPVGGLTRLWLVFLLLEQLVTTRRQLLSAYITGHPRPALQLKAIIRTPVSMLPFDRNYAANTTYGAGSLKSRAQSSHI